MILWLPLMAFIVQILYWQGFYNRRLRILFHASETLHSHQQVFTTYRKYRNSNIVHKIIFNFHSEARHSSRTKTEMNRRYVVYCINNMHTMLSGMTGITIKNCSFIQISLTLSELQLKLQKP